jgi:hypothetical protein
MIHGAVEYRYQPPAAGQPRLHSRAHNPSRADLRHNAGNRGGPALLCAMSQDRNRNPERNSRLSRGQQSRLAEERAARLRKRDKQRRAELDEAKAIFDAERQKTTQ